MTDHPPTAARRIELRLSGSGGQGIILAAIVLADAFAATGMEVLQTQSYGPEARGGASKAEIIVSTVGIDFPEVRSPDVTLCLSQPAFDKYAAQSAIDGLVLYDEELVSPTLLGHATPLAAPFAGLAQRRFGKVVVANMIAVGSVQRLIGWLPLERVREALKGRVPARFLDLNLLALELGASIDIFAGTRKKCEVIAPCRS